MSKTIQIIDHGCSTVFLMREEIQILTVEKDDGDGLIATFSDGTTAIAPLKLSAKGSTWWHPGWLTPLTIEGRA